MKQSLLMTRRLNSDLKCELTVGDFNSYFFGTLRGSTLRFERFFSWSTTLYLNLIGRGVIEQHSTCKERPEQSEKTHHDLDDNRALFLCPKVRQPLYNQF